MQSAYEAFERGWMLWRGDDTKHYVFFAGGAYRTFYYPPAEPSAFACADAQALGRPRRGFSTVWCQEPGVRGQLGNATGDEIGDMRSIQEFENGFMIYVKERDTVVMAYRDGTWREQP